MPSEGEPSKQLAASAFVDARQRVRDRVRTEASYGDSIIRQARRQPPEPPAPTPEALVPETPAEPVTLTGEADEADPATLLVLVGELLLQQERSARRTRLILGAALGTLAVSLGGVILQLALR